MGKFLVTDYGNMSEILKFPDHYVALAVTVSDEGVEVNEDGKKIVPAGTILGGKDGSILAKDDVLAVKNNEALGAEGVLFRDTDVTYGPASGAMIIHGFIDANKLPEPPAEGVEDTLRQIHFIK